jgi:hypothetical protein
MTTIKDAQLNLRSALLAGELVNCPCCQQKCKIYKRKLNANMARFLISLMRHEETEWVHYKECDFTGRDYPYVSLWGLAETRGSGETAKRMSGFWRLTPKGRSFVQGGLRISSHIKLYNNTVGAYEGSTSIQEALGSKFDYAELMGE